MKSGSLRTHHSEGSLGGLMPASEGEEWTPLHLLLAWCPGSLPRLPEVPRRNNCRDYVWGLAAVPVQLHSLLQALAQDICREVTCGQRCQPAARVLPSPGCTQGANTVHLHHPAQGCTGKWPQASNVSLCKAEFMLCLCGMTGWETSPPGRRGKRQY